MGMGQVGIIRRRANGSRPRPMIRGHVEYACDGRDGRRPIRGKWPRRIRVRWPRRTTTDTRAMGGRVRETAGRGRWPRGDTRAMAATDDDDRYAGDRYAGDGRAREGDGGTRTMAAWRDADDERRSSDLLTKSESLIVMSLVVMSGGGECETNNSSLFLCARE